MLRSWLRRTAALLVILTSLLRLPTVQAQTTPRITVWRASDGLPSSATLGIALTPRGEVLTVHGAMHPLARLDGYSVQSVSNLMGASTRVSTSRSEQLWSVDASGLLELTANGWSRHPLPEILNEYQANPQRSVRPPPILPLDRNHVLILLPDQLLEYDAGERRSRVMRRAADTALGTFFELNSGRSDSAWISGKGGLLRIPGPLRQITRETVFDQFPTPPDLDLREAQRPFESRDGAVTFAAEDSRTQDRIVVRFSSGEWQSWPVPGRNLRQAWAGPDGTLWGHTAGSVFRLDQEDARLRAQILLQVGRIADVAVEPSGVAWLATSEGVMRLAPLPWRPAANLDPETGPALTVTSDRRGQVIALSPRALHRLEGTQWSTTALPLDPRDEGAIRETVLFPLPDGGLFIHFPDGSLQVAADGTTRALTGPLAVAQPLGSLADGRVILWINSHLDLFDGTRLTPLAEWPTDLQPLGTPAFAFQPRSGELWIGTSTGLAIRRGVTWSTVDPGNAAEIDGVLAACELPDGRILVGGHHSVREFDGRSWRVLRRGFDRVRNLQLARDGTVWIASGIGLSRYKEDSWFMVAEEEGLPAGSIARVFEDGAGRLWAASTRGLFQFDATVDTDPPRAEITTADVPKSAGDSRALFVVGGEDRWRFTPAGRLLYSWRIDSSPWSVWRPASSVQYTNLTAGTHRFFVRAMDTSGNTQAQPAAQEFLVTLPWFKEPRLVWTSIALAVLLVALGLQAAVSYWRLKHSYAEVERQVADRTAALEKANAELLHSQKMRALGTLAAGVAHDFNNLLSIIKGSAQLLESPAPSDPKTLQRLRRIQTAVDQGTGLVRAMLGYSRGGRAPRQELQPEDTVRTALRLLEDRLPGRIQFLPPGGPLPPVLASPEMLQQIVLNLVENADEAMDHRGTVTVALSESTVAPGGILPPKAAPSYVVISVRDHGIGIPREHLNQIFEPFFTTKGFSSRRGTGLGLSMAYEFAKELGAGIDVDSTLGQGSRFSISLPAHLPSDSPTAATAAPSPA